MCGYGSLHSITELWGMLYDGRELGPMVELGYTLNDLNQLTCSVLNSTLSHMLLGGDNCGTGLNWKISFVFSFL